MPLCIVCVDAGDLFVAAAIMAIIVQWVVIAIVVKPFCIEIIKWLRRSEVIRW